MVHFEDRAGHVSKSAVEAFGGFREVPSQNTEGLALLLYKAD